MKTRPFLRVLGTGALLAILLVTGLPAAHATPARIPEQAPQPAVSLQGALVGPPSPGSLQNIGGPDPFGYVYSDSDEPGGPSPAFEDISSIGTVVDLQDYYTLVDLPFAFPFYGNTYTQAYLYGDCFYCYGDWTHISFGMPSSAVDSIWWMNEVNRDSGTVYVYADLASNPARYIIQYDQMETYTPYATTTSEVILYADGNILIRYADDFSWWQSYYSSGTPWLYGETYSTFRYSKSLDNDFAVEYYYPQGVRFWPQQRLGAAVAGEDKVYTLELYNYSGTADSFALDLAGNAWPTTVTPAQTGLIPDGGSAAVTVTVTVPAGTPAGTSDQVALLATGLSDPDLTATAYLTTAAFCSPALVDRGESSHGVVHDDRYDYVGQMISGIYVEGHTNSGWNSLIVSIYGYDPATGSWDLLVENGEAGPDTVLLDSVDIPPRYNAVRVSLTDGVGADAYYDYQFVVCREPRVVMTPGDLRSFSEPGTTVVYTETLTNWMIGAEDFALATAGNAWPTTFWQGSNEITHTGLVADRESFTFTVHVDIPAGAVPPEFDVASIQVTPLTTPTASASAVVTTTAVGDLVYVVHDIEGMVIIDTASQSVIDVVDLLAANCNGSRRIALTAGGRYAYISCYYSSNVLVFDTVANQVIAEVPGINSPMGRAAFTRNGYALVPSETSEIAVIDTTTYSIVRSVPLPILPLAIATHPYRDLAYVMGPNSILVLDTVNWNVVTEVPISDYLSSIAVSPDGQWVQVTGYSEMYVISTLDNSLYTTVSVVPDMRAIEITPDGSKAFIPATYNDLHVIDETTFEPVATVPFPNDWLNNADISCDGRELYVVSAGEELFILDTASYSLTGQVYMPANHGQDVAACPQEAKHQVILFPPSRSADTVPGTSVLYEATLVNSTGVVDSFSLDLLGNSWPATPSITNTGPLPDGAQVTLTVQVDVPPNAPWYATDTALLQATADSAPGLYSGTLPITTRVYAPPDLSFHPQGFDVVVPVGETTSDTLSIANGNGVSLTFGLRERYRQSYRDILDRYAYDPDTQQQRAIQAAAERGTPDQLPTLATYPVEAFRSLQGHTKMLTWPAYSSDTEYENTLNAIALYYTDLEIEETTTLSATELAALLADKEVFLIPDQDRSYYDELLGIGSSWATVLQDFCASGGTVVALDQDNSRGLLEGAGLLTTGDPSGGAWNGTVDVNMPEHPLAANVPPSFSGGSPFLAYDSADGDWVITYEFNNFYGPVVVGKDYGGGHVALLAMHFSIYNEDMARVLANAVQWYSTDIPWISEEPVSGTVAANSEQPVIVSFDALTLPAGTYMAKLAIDSNDPQQPVVFVSVTMTVIASADVGVALAGPPTVQLGETFAYRVDYSNNGTDMADGVTITDTLPPGVLYLADNAPFPHFGGGAGPIIWTAGSWPSGTAGSFLITATVSTAPAGSLFVNAVDVASSTYDEQPGNNHATVTSTLVCEPLLAAFQPATATVAIGEAVQFTNQSDGTAPLTYRWSFGDGITSTAANPAHTYTAPGVYTVELQVGDPCGITATATGMVAVTLTCQPLLAAFEAGTTEAMVGVAITMTNESSGTAPLAFLWSFGDGITSTAASPVHSYTATGTYTVTLTVTDPCQQQQVATALVHVRPAVYQVYLPLILRNNSGR